jgi:hypothetical protein
MQKVETTIDKIGDDFSVQKFDPAEYVLLFLLRDALKGVEWSERSPSVSTFTSPVPVRNLQRLTVSFFLSLFFLSIYLFNSQDALLKLLSDSSSSVGGLEKLNVSFASSTTAAINNVQTSFDNLATSIKTAAGIAIAPFPEGAAVTCK